MRDRLKELSKCRKAWEKLVREWKENKGWTLATKFNDLRIIIKKNVHNFRFQVSPN